MADDLDDFFDDVEEAAANAVDEEEGKEEVIAATASLGNSDGHKKELEADQEPEKKDDAQPPPAKRQKMNRIPIASAGATVRPKGVVVASSASVHSTTSSGHDVTSGVGNSGVGRTGGSMHHATSGPSTMNMNGSGHVGHHGNGLPPLPPGPVPPPPPPPPPAGGADQEDPSSAIEKWPDNDFRIFVGNLGSDVTDAKLYDHFAKYASIAKAAVAYDHKQGKSKGFGFVSFLQPLDCAKAIREMDQSWLSSRPIRVKRKDKDVGKGNKQNKKWLPKHRRRR